MSQPERMPVWERLGIGVAAIALAAVLIALLSGYFTRHDPAAVGSGQAPGVGTAFPGQGDAILGRSQLRPLYNSNPPTSGAHVRAPIERQDTTLSDDQLLTAVAAGNVVVLYGTRRPPKGLQTLVRRLAAPFTPALAAAGQALILGRRAHIRGVVALAWRHLLRQTQPDSATLTQFVDRWLGQPPAG